MSSFLLSLISPILRKMVCGEFEESFYKRISLDDVEEGLFLKLVWLACGDDVLVSKKMAELLDIGRLADRLQMDAVKECIEDLLLKELKERNCLDFFRESEANGMERLERESYKMLCEKFEAVSQQAAFEELSEETMEKLLEEDELAVEREEYVFEACVSWIIRRGEGYRGEKPLRKIRYGVIKDEYLASGMLSALPGHVMLKNLVNEAMSKKGRRPAEGEWDGVERMCCKWMAARRMKGRVLGAGILTHPRHVAIDSQGHFIVSDWTLHEILVFSHYGSVVRRIGSKGAAAGQFNEPMGVAVDRQGRIVVADGGNDRIQLLNPDGSVARCFGSKGRALGQLRCPAGAAIDTEGRIVVADSCNHRIQVFDADDGSVARHFGSRGAAVGQLHCPMDVAVDGAGRTVVADSGNHRVQVFDVDGSVVLCFGSKGDAVGQLQDPCGVVVDREGRFVVTDTNNHRVQVFSSDGSVAHVVASAAGDGSAGEIKYPFGVVVDGAGRIVVVMGRENPRVQFL